mgnify:CR=1 FL=1
MPYVGQKPADIIATAVDTTTGTFSGNVTTGGTLGVTGAVTANAGVVVDNITIDGTTIALSSGTLTLDSASQMILDAAGGNHQLFINGTEYGRFFVSSGDFYVFNPTSDKDILFYGNDGGSNITALTLDMSAAGEAKFNDNITMSTAGKGIHLGVTSATATNLLDDYEEGTWTAVAADSDGNLGTSDSRGKYVKIGSLVYVSFLLPNINTTGMSSSAKFEVRGLPFTVNDSNYGMGSMFFSGINLSTATNVTLSPAAETGTTRIRFFESSDNGAYNEITANYIADDTADIHACSISYFTNS